MSRRVGIGIPCHVNDIELCERFPLSTISLLEPQPHKVLVCVNEGGQSGLKEIRIALFDKLFLKYNCDIVFSMCVDYRIINRNLMNEAPPDKVMNYGRFFNTPIIGLMHYIARRCTRTPWSSMYSIPRKIWFNDVRDNPVFNGFDGSIPRCVNMDFESHMGINYMLMRRNTKRLIEGALDPKFRSNGLVRSLIKMSQGIKI